MDHPPRSTAILRGGPLDELVVRGVDTARAVLLMPTTLEAVHGEAPPTAPYFAEYRHTGQFDMHMAVFTFIGIGITVEAEEVTTTEEPRAIAP